MARFDGVRRLLRITRTRAGIERAVDDELRFHFDMTMRDLMANGMTPDEARKEAERRFGDLRQTRERLTTIDRALAGQERRAEWWSAFVQDTRYALRGLRLKPGFAAAVIVTLGLGIGANATMFGIVDRLLFRPPTFLESPDRTHRLYITRYRGGTLTWSSIVGYQRYSDLRAGTTSFDAMAPFVTNRVAVGSGDATEMMAVGVVGAELWAMFDAKPVIGRFFTAAEDSPPAGTNVVVLSHALWQTRFGGRQNAIGSAIDIGSKRYMVIGVAPKNFSAFSTAPLAAFIPMSAASTSQGRDWNTRYNASWFEIVARRKPGVSVEQATADLSAAYQRSYRLQLERDPDNSLPYDVAKPNAMAGPLLADRGPDVRSDVKVATWLAGVAGIVLLIACANVANLLLARALRRRREIAVRLALGIGRARLAMQLVTESMLLAILGAMLGVLLSHWGGSAMRATLLPDTVSATLSDSRLLLFATMLALVTGLATGLAPMLQARRSHLTDALKSGSRDGTSSRSKVRAGLLVAQAALSVVLLVGAGLFLRSLMNVRDARLGYDADRVLWVEMEARGTRFDSAQRVALRERLRARAAALPSVERAALGLSVPFRANYEVRLFIAGIDSDSALGRMTLQSVSPEFFETAGTHIVRGRAIAATDRGSARVMVVGESMAKRLWPGKDPIGQCIRVAHPAAPCTVVVGVAEDVRRRSLAEPEMHYYVNAADYAPHEGGVYVRTRGRAVDHSDEVRRALQLEMPGTSYVTVVALSSLIDVQMRSWQLGATMFTIFGVLALILAAVGLYSVIAYSVTQRTHEMGVRVALGAESREVIVLILGEGMRVVIPGVALGAVAALAGGRWIAPLLFQVSAADPLVFATVASGLMAVAVVASWIPAMRASRVDPCIALRAD